jgi:hypothetical protein
LNVDLLRENNNKLLEIISELNLTNVIKEPTRNGALLDPILVSNLDIVIDSEVISVNRDISDHGIITSYQIISPEAKFKSYLGFTQISCDVYTRTPPPKQFLSLLIYYVKTTTNYQKLFLNLISRM